MNEYYLAEANKRDNEDILSLLNSVTMSSKVPIRFDRSPNYFVFEDALKFLSAHHLLARDEHGTPLGFLHCDVLEFLGLNGTYEPFVCLGNLKVHHQVQRKKIAQKLISKMAELQTTNRYAGAYCLVNEGNESMLGLINTMFAEDELGLSHHHLGFLHTHSILLYGKSKIIENNNLIYGPASLKDLQDIIALFQEVHGQSFLAAKVDEQHLLTLFNSSLNLSEKNFRVLKDKTSQKIVAFTLIWDQGPFKKLYVDRYSLPLKILRGFIDISSYFKKCQRSPACGMPWRFFETTYLTVKDHDIELYDCFLKHIFNEFVGKDWHFFNVGLCNPQTSSFFKDFISERIKTHIFYFHLKNRDEFKSLVKNRPVYIDTWFI